MYFLRIALFGMLAVLSQASYACGDTWLNPMKTPGPSASQPALGAKPAIQKNALCLSELQTIFSGMAFNTFTSQLERVEITGSREYGRVILCRGECWSFGNYADAAAKALFLGLPSVAEEIVVFMRPTRKLDVCVKAPGVRAADAPYNLAATAAVRLAVGADVRNGDTVEVQYSDGAIHTFIISFTYTGGPQIWANHKQAGAEGEPKCR
ncbi:MAG: hypothetical protein ACK5O3_04965 [Burkholderiales bacterium]|jgi:hypothetical protein